MTSQLKTMKTVALEKATPANCGAKAAACAELAKVAAGADFRTPAGVCLPFGTMDAAIKVCFCLGMLWAELPHSTCALVGQGCSNACRALQDEGLL